LILWRKEKAVAGELRDSFRQAMSEMFMGDDPNNKKAEPQNADASVSAGVTSSANEPRQAPVAPTAAPRPAAPNPAQQAPAPVAPAARTGGNAPAGSVTGSIPVTGRSTVIRHVEQNPAEAQLARMSQDMSGLTPEFTDVEQGTGEETTGTIPAVAPTSGNVTAPTNDDTEEAAEPQGPIRSSIIAEGTEITGEVKFGSDAEVYGTLNAKVVSEDDILTNTGTITGDVVAKNLDMLNAEIKGDVATYGDLRLSDSSVLTGDVAAMRMDLRGQLVGNSAVRREMNVHSTAKLAGDVEAGSLAVGHGAKVRGFVNVGFEEE